MTPGHKDFALVLQEIYDQNPAPNWQDKPKLTHVFARMVGPLPTICFEGTLNAEEWINRDFDLFGWETFSHPAVGPLHDGMARGVEGVLPQIMAYLGGLGWPPFAVVGHSKGGGEALIAAAMLVGMGHAPAIVRAFEPPRVGTQRLADCLRGVDVETTQTLNADGADLVTLVPSFPPWKECRDPLVLRVPDKLSVVEKHKLPAVLAAL